MASGTKFFIEFEADTSKAAASMNQLSKTMKEIESSAGRGKSPAHHGMPAGKGISGVMGELSTLLVGAKQSMFGFSRALGSVLGGGGLVFAGVIAGLEVVQGKCKDIQSMGLSIMGAGVKSIQMIGSFMSEMMTSSSNFEMVMKNLQIIGGLTKKEAFGIGGTVRELVAYTPFMESHLLGLSAAMVRAGVSVDQFSSKTTLLDMFNKGLSRVDASTLSMAKNMKVNVLSSMADFIAATKISGHQIETYFKKLSTAIETGSLRMTGYFSGEVVERLKKVAKKGGLAIIDEIQKINIEKGFIGFAAAASTTMEGIISNLKEVPEQIYKIFAEVGTKTGPYERIKKQLIEVFGAVSAALFSEDFQKNLRELLAPTVDVIVEGLKLLTRGIKEFTNVVKNSPMLMKFIGSMILWGPVIVTVTGAIIALVGTVGVLTTTLIVAAAVIGGAVYAAFALLGPVVIPIAALFVALTAGIAGVTAAFGIGVAGSWGKVVDFFRDVGVVIQGLVEALWNWEGETTWVSEETANALEKNRFKDVFFNIIGWIYNATQAWDKFIGSLTAKGPDGVSTFDKLKGGIDKVITAAELLIGQINAINPASEGLDKSMGIFDALAGLLRISANLLDTITSAALDLANALFPVYAAFKTIKGALDPIYDLAMMTINAFISMGAKLGYILQFVPGLRNVGESLIEIGKERGKASWENMKDFAKDTKYFLGGDLGDELKASSKRIKEFKEAYVERKERESWLAEGRTKVPKSEAEMLYTPVSKEPLMSIAPSIAPKAAVEGPRYLKDTYPETMGAYFESLVKGGSKQPLVLDNRITVEVGAEKIAEALKKIVISDAQKGGYSEAYGMSF